ncbi:hypothetical protein TGAMA5MH_05996 [Trichoderma gamsii]|uniref:Uncharacterized protein n=1 Tax=Trichoderma gamsii TaxID=398673 RepID=A0A2K0T9W2_9HYPO|nr:hypothetical protein TGAMA5MH_05996 [Trichoderma gamsii]
MVHRNRALVRYIWLCLELEEYDCAKCAAAGRLTEDEMVEMYAINDTTNGPITAAFDNLFSVLSKWDPNGNLTLDISVYSHSDSKYWVKNLTFIPDTPSATICRIFHAIIDEAPFDSEQLELQWWDQLPLVPVVTKLFLRQQSRGRWRPDAFAHIFSRFPRLEELHYKSWREWDSMKRDTDRRSQYLFKSIQRFNLNLKRLAIFENFDQHYSAFQQRFMD